MAAFAFLNKIFKLKDRDTTILTEIRAGLSTFVTMSYIIAVNAAILSDSGGTCVCPQDKFPCPAGADSNYDFCLFELRKSLITATSLAAMVATILVGGFANLPFGVAPGMGINAFFAYNLVGFHGTGPIPYKTALGAVFIEGIIFFLLAVLGLRQWLARIIPRSLSLAMGAGIGLFLAHIGLQSNEGIGLITNDNATLLTLGGCPLSDRDASGTCIAHRMEGATTWAGIAGFVLISLLMIFRVRGSIMIGILFISIVSWFRGSNQITYFPDTNLGNSRFDFFRKVVDVPTLSATGGQLSFDFSSGQFWLGLVTMLYTDIFDTTGTMNSMANFADLTKANGQFEGSDFAYVFDSISISLGALMGTSPVTPFIESAAGIAEGGKTGLTAIVIGLFFFLSLFFSPIFASLPPWATGPALIVVGSMMMASNVRKINWSYHGDSIPAFVTIVLMPLTYSVAYGLIGGIGMYIVLNGFTWIVSKASSGKFAPDTTSAEPLPWENQHKIPLLPVWVSSLASKIRPKGENDLSATVTATEDPDDVRSEQIPQVEEGAKASQSETIPLKSA